MKLLLCGLVAVLATASQGGQSTGSSAFPKPYDKEDPADLRLWEGKAPGAVGNDPAWDVPYLRVFNPSGASQSKPAILIIPGGGYDRLSNETEQDPVAKYFSRKFGVAAFVLYYRLAQKDGTYRYPTPMWDGQRAIKLLRDKSNSLGIDPNRICVFGFSAGGHLASTLALHSATDFDLPSHDSIDEQSARVNLLGLGYPVISMDPDDVPPSGSYKNLLRGYRGSRLRKLQTYLSGEKNVTAHTPPTFIFESKDDSVISPANTELFVEALHQTYIPVESHIFPHGEHGSGLSVGIAGEDQWPELFHQWLIRRKFLDR